MRQRVCQQRQRSKRVKGMHRRLLMSTHLRLFHVNDILIVIGQKENKHIQ